MSLLYTDLQKVAEGEDDCYSELVEMLTRLAPPISFPWLTSDLEVPVGGVKRAYLDLKVKKTISRPKRKK